MGFDSSTSSVMPVVRCSDDESGTLTRALVPLNDSAFPNLPEAVHVAFASVPVFPLPDESVDLIVSLRDQGLAILLSEQSALLSLAIADRGYVMENGRIALTGAGQELVQSKEVADRYLGAGVQLKSTSGDEIKGKLSDRLRKLLDT